MALEGALILGHTKIVNPLQPKVCTLWHKYKL